MAGRSGWRVCSTPGCPEFSQGGKCDEHRREAEQRRGSARQRGYGKQHERRFRPGVLARHPACVCTDETHGHGTPCAERSAHADHWPLSRRQLIEQGKDPDDPKHGRGLCGSCHSKETAANPDQQGGWARH